MKTLKKFEILTQNHGLTRFEKIQDDNWSYLTSSYVVRITLILLQNIN